MGARTRGLANNVLSSGKLDATDAISGTIAAGNIANDSLTSATTFGSVSGGVPQVAGDPPAPAEGDIWYNTSTGTLRFRSVLQAWSSGGNLNNTRLGQGGAGRTDNTASIVFGGGTFGPQAGLSPTESYDGTTWTEVNDLNTARYYTGESGTTTSALCISGRNPALGTPTQYVTNVESWNGTSWTEITDVNSLRSKAGGDGVDNTSALFVAGNGGDPDPTSTKVESWNGSTWTEVNDVNTGREGPDASGIQTSMIAFGGNDGTSNVAINESWNGTSWTEVADMNTVKNASQGVGADNTSALAYGGSGGVTATESWNGSAWTEVGNMATGRNDFGASGSTSSAIAAGGAPPPLGINTTEEWTQGDTTFTVG